MKNQFPKNTFAVASIHRLQPILLIRPSGTFSPTGGEGWDEGALGTPKAPDKIGESK